ncbi:hypothetical protein SUGI_0325680 [Cryptomeria japonica]|nr:hypothetical protein SUGI_0325680 [Cryptomeria japonica]
MDELLHFNKKVVTFKLAAVPQEVLDYCVFLHHNFHVGLNCPYHLYRGQLTKFEPCSWDHGEFGWVCFVNRVL